MPVIIPPRQTALDLHIKGSLGEFFISSDNGVSVPVQYVLTHVGLDTSGGHEERLLSRLAPFREVFDVASLDFDQIMQRDIDDARVSAELIPYLLENATSGLVKLFPPIVAVALPVDQNGAPSKLYPEVARTTESNADSPGVTFENTRSGNVGQEVFAFRQMVLENQPQPHDYAELRINTNRCRLVIVDGQHRAMSLLALYRNLRQWPDKTHNVAPYYKLWSPDRIRRYDLSHARLPIMVCTFPSLSEGKPSAGTVYGACRSVFLALNKNARPVTRSRNILLDDRDLVASLLRKLLGEIKSFGIGSPERIRLWGVELDNDADRIRIVSPVAISSVTHLFGLLERLLISPAAGPGLGVKAANPWLAKRLDRCIERLGLRERFTPQEVNKIRRESYDESFLASVIQAFSESYLRTLIAGLDSFAPYRSHHDAVLALHQRLQAGPTADFFRAILLEGEGMGRVFEEFREHIERLATKDEFATPELQAIQAEFANRNTEIEKEVVGFYVERAKAVLNKGSMDPNSTLFKWVRDDLYQQNLTTAAFQAALFMTFWGVIEQVNSERQKPPTTREPIDSGEILTLFQEYLQCLNVFFDPSDDERLQRLVAVLTGELKSDGTIVASSHALRRILLPGEMKPDEWPKFRAVLQELWRPSSEEIGDVLSKNRKLTRQQTLERYIDRELKDLCRQLTISENDLTIEQREETQQRCAESLAIGLGHLGVSITPADLLNSIKGAPPSESVE